MLLISHRGNMHGPSNNENHPDQITLALKEGFQIEIDVWYLKNDFFLGHDEPTYKVSEKFLMNENFWLHAKNLDALSFLSEKKTNCFWHQEDNYTLTSKGYIWSYIGMTSSRLSKKTISVLPEINNSDLNYFCGICSDYIYKYRSQLKK